MKIIYTGPLWEGSTTLQRMQAMQELNHEIIPIDSTSPTNLKGIDRFVSRARNRLGFPRDLRLVNLGIVEAIQNSHADILWLDKSLQIKPDTFLQIKNISPRTLIVGYSPDDMMQKHNTSYYFRATLPLYDYFFTTKSYGVAELKKLGAKNPIFVENAYDSQLHMPMIVSESDKKKYGGSIGFVGAWERDRAKQILAIADAGFKVRWWGGWDGKKSWIDKHPNLRYEYTALWGTDYVKAINSFDINLCFLRKINRDLQTQRTMEIPASGGFMLAERSSEHSKLFIEGLEVDFFSNETELINKIKYYLDNSEKRIEIAQAGRLRCLTSGYSNKERINWMLNFVMNRI